MEAGLLPLPGTRRRTRGTWRGAAAALRRPGSSVAAPIVAMIRVWRRRSDERQLLATFSERERRDLALSIADIMAEVAKPFWRG